MMRRAMDKFYHAGLRRPDDGGDGLTRVTSLCRWRTIAAFAGVQLLLNAPVWVVSPPVLNCYLLADVDNFARR